MRAAVLILDAESLATGLSAKHTTASALVAFHRIVIDLWADYVAEEFVLAGSQRKQRRTPRESEIILACGTIDHPRVHRIAAELLEAGRVLGLTLASGDAPTSSLIAMLTSRCNGSALVVSDDPLALGLLTDRVSVLAGACGTQRLVTAETEEETIHMAPEPATVTCSISPVAHDLSRVRWHLAEIGAEEALRPAGWRKIEEMIG